jgi:hypothetical protein
LIKAVIHFSGTARDPFGMPTPYHSYFVVASPWQGQAPGSAIASIVPLSTAAPLSQRQHAVLTGGERAAFDEAVNALSAENANASLTPYVHEG